MFAIFIFTVITNAFAGNQDLVANPRDRGAQTPFFAASESEILSARCRQDIAPSNEDMKTWLYGKARYEDARQTSRREATEEAAKAGVRDSIFGLRILKDSPYLVGLLETLLKKEPLSDEGQKVFSSHCDGVLCAAQEIFGERIGVQLLYMLAKYGFNGAHQRMKNADPWTADELDEAMVALSDLPAHLATRPARLMNHPLVHFSRNDASSQRPLANAIIYVYNVWNSQPRGLRRYSLFHEFGHNMGLDFGLDSGKAWARAAGWEEKDYEWFAKSPESKISQYAATNPDEDFAESFAAYRYSPIRLRKTNPAIYQFMKTKVFRNVEYLTEQTCGNRH